MSRSILLCASLLASCTSHEDGPGLVRGHEFHPNEQDGILRFVDDETEEVTEYEVGLEDCSWLPFVTHETDSWNWEDRPHFLCSLENDLQADIHLSALPTSEGWPESSSIDDTTLVIGPARSTAPNLVSESIQLRIDVTRNEGEVLPIPPGATSETPDVELTTDDYVREYTIMGEVNCSDDPDCGGV